MWDADADKYWKEKEKAKRRADKRRKAGLGVAAGLVLLFAARWLVVGDGIDAQAAQAAVNASAAKTAVTPPPPPPPIPTTILASCRAECRVRAIDHCNNVCRFSHNEMPRPTVFRACQSPCVQLAQSMCDLGTHETAHVRKNCRTSSDNLAYQVCKEYENVLPRPRVQQVCKIGAQSGGPHSCKEAKQCVDKQLAAAAAAHAGGASV